MFKLLDLFVLGFHFTMVQSQIDYSSKVDCYIRSSTVTQCYWPLTTPVPDMRFVYRLINESGPDSEVIWEPCRSHRCTDNLRNCCNLQRNIVQSIVIVFKKNETDVTIPFKVRALENVRPPPLDLMVNQSRNHANISWTISDFPSFSWDYKLNITGCGKTEQRRFTDKTSYPMTLNPQCQYCVVVKAVLSPYYGTDGETPWSEEKCFAAEAEPNLMMYATLIVPLVFTILAALMFFCWWTNKDKIFPKVPQPRDLITDMLNNNKVDVLDWCVPVEEEENCKIILVMDPKLNKVD